MKHDCDDNAVACSLSKTELREREATLLAQFKSRVIATEELTDGYAFRVPADTVSMAAVEELIAAERECCRFLAFELTTGRNMGPAILRVSGPSGSKEFIKQCFADEPGA